MSQPSFTGYSSFAAVTPSDATLVTCRGLYIGTAGNVTISPDATGATTFLFTAPPVGSILPIILTQGRVMAATTAGAIVALS